MDIYISFVYSGHHFETGKITLSKYVNYMTTREKDIFYHQKEMIDPLKKIHRGI